MTRHSPRCGRTSLRYRPRPSASTTYEETVDEWHTPLLCATRAGHAAGMCLAPAGAAPLHFVAAPDRHPLPAGPLFGAGATPAVHRRAPDASAQAAAVRRVSHCSHWGAYTLLVKDGRIQGVEAFVDDPAPSPIIHSVATWADSAH